MKENTNIKKLFIFLALLVTTLMLLIIVAMTSLSTSYSSLKEAEQTRYQSYLLANELRQSSDNLTRLARTYVITGNSRYRDQYQSIIDIRNGQKARPLEYERIYWDYLAVPGHPAPRLNGESAPLTQLMKDIGFSDEEMSKLEQAKGNSDDLVLTETIAMDAVLANDNISKNTEISNIFKNISMMYDEKYHADKLHIMKPIDDFFGLLNQRTLQASQNALLQTQERKFIIYTLLATSVLILYLSLIFTYRILIKSQTTQLINQQVIQKQSADLIISNDLLKEENKKKEEQAKELIKANAEAKMASVAKSQFLANMSHEIRTPMNGVIGILDLLNKEPLNKKQQQYIAMAKSSTDSLLYLINDILDISKIEDNKIDIEIIGFNIHELFEDVVSTMSHSAQSKELNLILDIANINNIKVTGDPNRIRQVLVNLVGNAIKFTQKGQVLIRADLNENHSNDGMVNSKNLLLRCDITDTGIGISNDKLSQLFESFTQADSSTTRKYGGSGLGLSIVKQLCQLMGGDVEVTSEVGQGSQFTFTLKLEQCDDISQPTPHINMSDSQILAPDNQYKDERILLVEDNKINQLVALGILELSGGVADIAEDGQQAIDMLKKSNETPYSLIFMDCQMPVMDGFTATQNIRNGDAGDAYRDVPIIAMTANAMQGDRERCIDAGMNDYLSKPIDEKLVVECLGKWLSNSKK